MSLGDIDKDLTDEARKARVIIEKKTVINLLEAFSVAVKHYLRGEDGIFYTDLYYLVKYLPAYALPTGIPSQADLSNPDPQAMGSPLSRTKSPPLSPGSAQQRFASRTSLQRTTSAPRPYASASAPHLPLPTSSSTATKTKRPTFLEPIHTSKTQTSFKSGERTAAALEEGLLPARMPPKWYILDLFPFSLLVKALTKSGRELKGKKAAKLRAKLRNRGISHNLPLEISLYLVSWAPCP